MKNIKGCFLYLKTFVIWVLISLLVGLFGGMVGVIFHKSIDLVTEIRHTNNYLIYYLPLGGIVIACLYKVFRNNGKLNTDGILESVRDSSKISVVIIPLIYISSCITHLFGGSAGREGAALQLGGGIGYNLGRIFKLNKNNMHIIVMAGMSSVFSALFGTPVTAAVFSLEVVNVGTIHCAGMIPCIISSAVAYKISQICGLVPVRFQIYAPDSLEVNIFAKVMLLAILCALVSIVFCVAVRRCGEYMKKIIHNTYLRAFTGGVIIVIMTLVIGSHEYNGAGMEIIEKAMSSSARPEAFALKIIFTALTVASGYKGGEIVPAFFVGATFGNVAGSFLGLNPGFAAAIGFVGVFCGVVNCPLASVVLAAEVFGVDGFLYFAILCSVCYMLSGNFSLYKSQKIVYSKISDDFIDEYTI